jgi:hypothetical protein
MRIRIMLAIPVAFASQALATPDYSFPGFSSDTTVYISGGSIPLVVQGGADGAIIDGYYRGLTVTSTGLAIKGDAGSGSGQVGVQGIGGTGVKGQGNDVGVIGDGGGTGVYGTGSTYGVHGTSNSTAVYGSTTNGTGIYGYASAYGNGMVAEGMTGLYAIGVPQSSWDYPTGIYARASGGYETYGILAEAWGGSNDDWAGFFNGKIYVGGTTYPSDIKLKKNVQPLSGGLEKIMALKPKTYEMKTEEYKGKLALPAGKQFGLIAQEVEQVFPEIVKPVNAPAPLTEEERRKGVKKEGTKFKSVDYTSLIPVLIEAIQEQQKEIEALKRAQAK